MSDKRDSTFQSYTLAFVRDAICPIRHQLTVFCSEAMLAECQKILHFYV